MEINRWQGLEKESYSCISCGIEIEEISMKGLSMICPCCGKIL